MLSRLKLMYNKKKVIYHKYNVIGFISLIMKKEKKEEKAKNFEQ